MFATNPDTTLLFPPPAFQTGLRHGNRRHVTILASDLEVRLPKLAAYLTTPLRGHPNLFSSTTRRMHTPRSVCGQISTASSQSLHFHFVCLPALRDKTVLEIRPRGCVILGVVLYSTTLPPRSRSPADNAGATDRVSRTARGPGGGLDTEGMALEFIDRLPTRQTWMPVHHIVRLD